MVNSLKSLVRDPGLVLKFVELILLTIGFFLWEADHLGLELFNNVVLSLLLIGFMIITLCLILAYVFEKTHHVIEPGLMFDGAVLSFIASGTLMVEWTEEPDDKQTPLPPYVFFVTLPVGLVMLADMIREVIIFHGIKRAASRIG